MSENEPRKGKIAKILDYLSCILKRKLLALLLGVKTSRLYTLQSSLKKDYYFILDKHTHTFLAVFGLGRREMLVGYNDVSKKIMDKKFEPLVGASERILTETLNFVNFLDITSFKPVLTKNISYKYLLVVNEIEYAIEKNNYTYEHEINGVTHFYSQESYVTIKDNELMFFNTFPRLFLVSDKNDLIHKKALLNKNDTDPIIQNIDLDLIFDDLKLLISGKGLTKNGILVLKNYDKAINLMKDYYLDSHYNGWKEVGYPQTPEDVQLLKMIAI